MSRALNILLVEDDTIEIMKFHRVITEMKVRHRVTEANDGQQAIEMLRDSTILPDIIILDLNMPKLNGIEFLKIIKDDGQNKNIPIIVFTTSSNYKEINQCYGMGAAGYLVKPLKYHDYITSAQKLIEYWSCNEFIN